MTPGFAELIAEHYFIPFYFLALIVSIVTYRKYFDTELKYFPIIIAYTFFNELLGLFIRYTDTFAFFNESSSDNDILFNLYTLIFFGYFYFTYWKIIANKASKDIIRILALVAAISFLINALFSNPLKVNLFYATSICSWVLLVIIGLYFKHLSPNWNWQREKYNLMVWTSIGLGIFYAMLPILFLVGFLEFELWQKYNLRELLKVLIVLMNAIFIIGFLISRRRAFR